MRKVKFLAEIILLPDNLPKEGIATDYNAVVYYEGDYEPCLLIFKKQQKVFGNIMPHEPRAVAMEVSVQNEQHWEENSLWTGKPFLLFTTIPCKAENILGYGVIVNKRSD